MTGYNSKCGKLVRLLVIYYLTADIQVVSDARISYLSNFLLINQNSIDEKKNYSVTLDADDNIHMKHAIRLASKALGKTSPNPVVGCIILDKNGKLVGEGWHEKAGKAHAEVVALRQAGKEAIGGTAYVSLEPCNHYGRTPPCTEALITYGISRVVAGIMDPDPRVSGGGLQYLQDQGITVRMNVEEEACKAINAPFIYRVLHKRPYMILWTSLLNSLQSKEGKSSSSSSFSTSQFGVPSITVINKLFIKLAEEVDALLITETQLKLLDQLSTLPSHIHIIILSSLPVDATDEEKKKVLLTVHQVASSHSNIHKINNRNNNNSQSEQQQHQLGQIDYNQENNNDSSSNSKSSRKWSVLFSQSLESYSVYPTLTLTGLSSSFISEGEEEESSLSSLSSSSPSCPPFVAYNSTLIQDEDSNNRNRNNSNHSSSRNRYILGKDIQPSLSSLATCCNCQYPNNNMSNTSQDNNNIEYNNNNNNNNISYYSNNNINNNITTTTTTTTTSTTMDERLLSHLLQLGCNAVLVFGGGGDSSSSLVADKDEDSFFPQRLTQWLQSGTVQRLIVSEQFPPFPFSAKLERKSINHDVGNNNGATEKNKQILESVHWKDFVASFISSPGVDTTDTEKNARGVTRIECINALLTSNRIEEEVVDDDQSNSTVVIHSVLLWKP